MTRKKYFNTTGPCFPEMHYMLPPEDRLRGAQLSRYIRDQLYWVLHAPRQTGKTTFLQNWMREINASGEAVACYVSVEACQGISEVELAIPSICGTIREFASSFGLPVPPMPENDVLPQIMLSNILGSWAEMTAPKPLVVLFDETDVLQDAALISFLRQLREGFARRGAGKFPVSIALVGMRDLKDYITASKGGIAPNPGSPFNIKEDSATLGNFSKPDIENLFAQKTKETGQQITKEALDYVYEQSKGQPWIVNSLFKRATMRVLDEDSTKTVTIEHIEEARQQMILARETHLDALAERLKDPKIRNVIQPIMTGEVDPVLAEGDPFRLCLDLGLVSIEDGTPGIANPIYREVLARDLTYAMQLAIPKPEWQWSKSDGTLNMDELLSEFQKFWRMHSEVWEQKSDYTEAFPHLLLMAFLQRVINGGGRIEREYAAGRGRMDLAVQYNHVWNIIEIKLLRDPYTFDDVVEEGSRQILRYRERIDSNAACYLVVFDRRKSAKETPWNEKLNRINRGAITIIGC